jgi:hypothetical protein
MSDAMLMQSFPLKIEVPRTGSCAGDGEESSTYESQTGNSYQIYYEENGAAHSVATAPEQPIARLLEFPKPAPSAASTPSVQ